MEGRPLPTPHPPEPAVRALLTVHFKHCRLFIFDLEHHIHLDKYCQMFNFVCSDSAAQGQTGRVICGPKQFFVSRIFRSCRQSCPSSAKCSSEGRFVFTCSGFMLFRFFFIALVMWIQSYLKLCAAVFCSQKKDQNGCHQRHFIGSQYANSASSRSSARNPTVQAQSDL